MELQSAEQLRHTACQACEGGVAAWTVDQAKQHMDSLTDWSLSENGKAIARKFVLKDFQRAVVLFNAVAELAEQEQHHPDLHLTGYRHLRIELTTHAIGGLSQNDFVVAAKIDAIAQAAIS